jgi:hypothetical protein
MGDGGLLARVDVEQAVCRRIRLAVIAVAVSA